MTNGTPPSQQQQGKLYLVGSGVSHAMAPAIHNAVIGQIGANWNFSNLDVKSKEEALSYIRQDDFIGCVPTMPLKIQLFDVVEELDEAAKAIGAINNIYKRDNRLFGANTDWIGISSKCILMTKITRQQSRLTILFPPCRIPTTSLA